MVGDLTRPVSYKTMLGRVCLGYPLARQSMESTHQSMHNVLLLSRPILSSYCLLRPWYVCLLAVAYGDSLNMSQAEVPLEWIHAFYWEMGPFIPSFAIFKTESREILT